MIIIIYCIKISLPQYRYSGKLNVCLLVMEKSTTTNSLPLILIKCIATYPLKDYFNKSIV